MVKKISGKLYVVLLILVLIFGLWLVSNRESLNETKYYMYLGVLLLCVAGPASIFLMEWVEKRRDKLSSETRG